MLENVHKDGLISYVFARDKEFEIFVNGIIRHLQRKSQKLVA